MISFDDFAKLELKVGTILSAEEVEGSEKLIKFQIDLGEESPRQILAGIKQWYQPEDLVGKQVVVVVNLEPKKMMGLESNGMLLIADAKDKLVFLMVPEEVSPGTQIR